MTGCLFNQPRTIANSYSKGSLFVKNATKICSQCLTYALLILNNDNMILNTILTDSLTAVARHVSFTLNSPKRNHSALECSKFNSSSLWALYSKVPWSTVATSVFSTVPKWLVTFGCPLLVLHTRSTNKPEGFGRHPTVTWHNKGFLKNTVGSAERM